MLYSELLKERKANVAVWGTGYLGYTTICYLAREGVKVIGYDIDKEKVAQINNNVCPVHNLDKWLKTKDNPDFNQNVTATTNWEDLINPNILVHFIAVPTEKNGDPWLDPLEDVVKKISTYIHISNYLERPPLIIIESTLVPGTTDKLLNPLFKQYGIELGKDLLYAISPRRDWFVDEQWNLKHIDRIYSGYDENSNFVSKDVLGIVCERIHQASSYLVAEMVKCVENSFRHVDITLTNQLCLAYPNIDIKEVMNLASTKWNMNHFYPSFGTGGYCIPLSSKYLIQGAVNSSELTILEDTIITDNNIRRKVAQKAIKSGCMNIVILGVSYKANLKVTVMSAAIGIADELKKSGVCVKAYDSMYSNKEVLDTIGVELLSNFDDVVSFADCVILVSDHQEFYSKDLIKAITNSTKLKLVLDNYGAWADQKFMNTTEYYYAGAAGWM
jgi:nucleotide sugar dehydrogenase